MGNKKEKIYVSQKVILFNENNKILTIRRIKAASSRSLYWDLPGGRVEVGENLRISIIREVREEIGVEIQDLQIIDAISDFNDRQEFWVTICYTAQSISEKIILSSEHNDYKWVTPDEFLELEISPRTKNFIERFKFLLTRDIIKKL